MNWKFWKKENKDKAPVAATQKLPRPKELPQEIGRQLVVVEGYDPDWAWSLKIAMKPQSEGSAMHDFRIFDETAAAQKGVRISSFSALDSQTDLILFEGWINRKTRQFKLEKTVENAV